MHRHCWIVLSDATSTRRTRENVGDDLGLSGPVVAAFESYWPAKSQVISDAIRWTIGGFDTNRIYLVEVFDSYTIVYITINIESTFSPSISPKRIC